MQILMMMMEKSVYGTKNMDDIKFFLSEKWYNIVLFLNILLRSPRDCLKHRHTMAVYDRKRKKIFINLEPHKKGNHKQTISEIINTIIHEAIHKAINGEVRYGEEWAIERLI